MFAGFNLHLSTDDYGEFLPYAKYARKLYNTQKDASKSFLDELINDEGIIDADIVEEIWFPQIESDVFISHSHMDEQLAVGIAGWLYFNYGIVSFIDSCVWGYANDLLKQVDNKYCVNKRNNDGTIGSYSYEKRNNSTSHIHAILNTALHKMIDQTECLIFLNTPNSMPLKNVVRGDATASPWIYSELMFSRMVQRKTNRELIHGAIFSESNLMVKYKVLLTHLVDIYYEDFVELKDNIEFYDRYQALDFLYDKGVKIITG